MYCDCEKSMKEMKKLQKHFDATMEQHCSGGDVVPTPTALKSDCAVYDAKIKTIRTKLQGMDKFLSSCLASEEA